jgi:hypothetical protein
MFICPPHGNDANVFFVFDVHDHHCYGIEHTDRDHPLLLVCVTRIFAPKDLTCENTFGIREIQTVFAQIFQTFGFVPRESHVVIICI